MPSDTPSQFITDVEDHLDAVSAEIQRKNADYAGDNPNPFAAFDSVAAATGLTREQVWLVYYLKGIQAIAKYIRDGNLDSEGIDNRLIDAAAYPAILAAMLKEKERGR